MAIDLVIERGLTLAEAAALIPSARPGCKTHVSRIARKIVRGEVLPDGTRDRLEAIRIGSQWITTARCIREHGERVAAAYVGQGDAAPPSRPSSASSRVSAELAARELDVLGFR